LNPAVVSRSVFAVSVVAQPVARTSSAIAPATLNGVNDSFMFVSFGFRLGRWMKHEDDL
jgi:hypothetical protein